MEPRTLSTSSLREVAFGDLIFSFVDTCLVAIGTAASYCYESPWPAEFGGVRLNWNKIGWRLRVNFATLTHRIRPKDHIDPLPPCCPRGTRRYSNRGMACIDIPDGDIASSGRSPDRHYRRRTQTDCEPGDGTDPRGDHTNPKRRPGDVGALHRSHDRVRFADPGHRSQALIVARRGHGLFKQRVVQIENHCRVTGVNNPVHLVGNHCKPWRDSSNEERLDGENGLLLAPTIDHLFDRAFIGCENSGELIVSPVAHAPSLNRMRGGDGPGCERGNIHQWAKRFS
jgi:putative restriction endonuclease